MTSAKFLLNWIYKHVVLHIPYNDWKQKWCSSKCQDQTSRWAECQSILSSVFYQYIFRYTGHEGSSHWRTEGPSRPSSARIPHILKCIRLTRKFAWERQSPNMPSWRTTQGLIFTSSDVNNWSGRSSTTAKDPSMPSLRTTLPISHCRGFKTMVLGEVHDLSMSLLGTNWLQIVW